MKKPQALIGLLAALGTAIGVLVAVIGLPYGRSDYTAFAELYHGTVGAAGTVHVSLDCNSSTPLVTDASCVVFLPGPASLTTAVSVSNSTGANFILGTFNFTATHTDPTRLVAQASGSPDSNLNSNPDFTADTTGLADWNCASPPPNADTDAIPANGDSSFISCANGVGSGPTIPMGSTNEPLANIYYNNVAVSPGVVPITLSDTAVFDDTFTEVQSCNPVVTTAGPCFNTQYDFQNTPTNTPGPTSTPAPPTNTPTNTATPTNTFTPTSTPTPLTDSGVVKVCENGGNPNGDTSCNLWLCVPDSNPVNDPDCDGPGEGSLHVHENAINVPASTPNGLGAYEFSVEYDNFVIQSVNPCDVVFSNQAEGPGAGFPSRGPVDEVDSSSPENADCNPDVNSNAAGTCTMSLVLENIIHFGCVTTGQNPGPTGSFTLASLELIPHPDLRNDIFPGNNNGVLTIIKDNGCELTDTLGHPIPGSINGGLTIICGDLAVTVRILEGDLDLDCDVDITDAQAIASHYGAFFGGLLYSKWLDLEPQFHDLDIDIKDIQKVFGRQGSTCQNPIPAQDPLPPPFPFGN